MRFDTRRRHFSAQECRDADQDASAMRHRCFSFSGLRDVLRRGSSQERHILLQRATTTELFTDDDSVFLSVELIGPDGAATSTTALGQPVVLPDDVRIVNNIEHIEVVSSTGRHRHSSGPCMRVRSSTRQRNVSAPDPSRKAARHSPQ